MRPVHVDLHRLVELYEALYVADDAVTRVERLTRYHGCITSAGAMPCQSCRDREVAAMVVQARAVRAVVEAARQARADGARSAAAVSPAPVHMLGGRR
ncbi:MAG: hypothetical protein KBD62_36795 [Kofleriaceae bacterium]|nr:hypothetical protein [Kofleriaceae bacterium]